MSGLAGLLERVRAATGPDREIDAAITIAIGDGPGEGWELIRQDTPGVHKMDAGCWINGMRIRTPKPYTASIDAALALTDRVLPPGVDISLKVQTGGKYCHAEFETEIDDKNGREVSEYNRPSIPLAILAATLSALIAKGEA